MFEIELHDIGKRYNRDWIFKNWTDTLTSQNAYVILGGNGSGKSTALRTLLGYATLSSGKISYKLDKIAIESDSAFKHFSFCSPYLELYEELTLEEMARFHFSLKPIIPMYNLKNFAEMIQLSGSEKKQVKYFSSGMKQRLRLGLALYSDTSAVLLDEPTSNLDKAGIQWYQQAVESLRGNRLFVVASNHQEEEYTFCHQKIQMDDLKPA